MAAAAAAVEADQDGLLDGIEDDFWYTIWIFRSGLNRRVPLAGGVPPAPGGTERLLVPLLALRPPSIGPLVDARQHRQAAEIPRTVHVGSSAYFPTCSGDGASNRLAMILPTKPPVQTSDI